MVLYNEKGECPFTYCLCELFPCQLPDIKEILLIGYYQRKDMTRFVQEMQKEYMIPVRYTHHAPYYTGYKPLPQVSAGVHAPGHCWRTVPLPRPDPARGSQGFLCLQL